MLFTEEELEEKSNDELIEIFQRRNIFESDRYDLLYGEAVEEELNVLFFLQAQGENVSEEAIDNLMDIVEKNRENEDKVALYQYQSNDGNPWLVEVLTDDLIRMMMEDQALQEEKYANNEL